MLQTFRKRGLQASSTSRTPFVRPIIARSAAITVVVFGLLAFVPANALGVSDFLSSSSSWFFSQASSLLYFLVYTLGRITAVLFDILVKISQYNGFLDAPAVNVGWRVVRDISNMFFIAILLLIAFGTLFRMQRYYYASMLRQLIVMAVLINFSKVITGFFIDMMQVIMMTFVGAYAETAAGNLTTALGLNKILELMGSTNAGTNVSPQSVFATLLLAVVLFAITTAIVLVFALIFLIRIVALWILTVLSPLAYVFAAFPQTNGYANKWWGEFWKYATIGPVLAFFLWLTLTITAAGNTYTLILAEQNETSSVGSLDTPIFSEEDESDAVSIALSSVSTSTGILSFMVSTILLVFSLSFASGISGGGAALASKLSGNIQRRGASIAKGVGRFPRRVLGGLSSVTNAGVGTQTALGKLGGAVASSPRLSRVPFLADAGRSAFNRMTTQAKGRVEEAGKQVGGLNDAMLRTIVNNPAWTPAERARKAAALKVAPYLIEKREDFKTAVQSMELDDFKKIGADRLANIQKRLGAGGETLHDVAPEKAEWLVKNASAQKRIAAGYKGWKLNKDTNLPESPDPDNIKMPIPDTTVVPKYVAYNPPDEGGQEGGTAAAGGGGAFKAAPTFRPGQFNATQAAVLAAGGADAFYTSAAYTSNPTHYLTRDEYARATSRSQARAAQQSASSNDIAGIATASRRGMRGEVATVSINPDDPAFAAIRSKITGEGAYVSGDQKAQVVQLLTSKYRNQLIDSEASRRLEEERLESAKAGTLLSPDEQRARQSVIRQQVESDALFNESVRSKADQFREGLTSASAISLVDKNGMGSIRQTIRHERAHGVTDMLSSEEKQQIWSALPPNRQAEVKEYIASHWANGSQMSDEEIAEEFITEHLANRGKNAANSMRLNPAEREKFLTTRHMIEGEYRGNAKAFYRSAEYNNGQQLFLNADEYNAANAEENIANRLDEMVGKSRYEKARRDVEAIPKETLHTFFSQLAGARQREVMQYLEVPEFDENRLHATENMIAKTFGGDPSRFFKSQYYQTDKGSYLSQKEYASYAKSRDDAERQFFVEALAAHSGEGQKGPLGFAKGESDLAFLIHAAAQNKRPPSSVATSVADVSNAPAAPRVVERPSGERHITAEPPERIVERVIETPPSPIVKANITNNNSIRGLGDEIMQKIGGKVQDMPSRADLVGLLNRLQSEIQGVGRQQSLTGFQNEISSLSSQIEQLKQDAQSPDTSAEGNAALQSNIQQFMKQLRSISQQGDAANNTQDKV